MKDLFLALFKGGALPSKSAVLKWLKIVGAGALAGGATAGLGGLDLLNLTVVAATAAASLLTWLAHPADPQPPVQPPINTFTRRP